MLECESSIIGAATTGTVIDGLHGEKVHYSTFRIGINGVHFLSPCNLLYESHIMQQSQVGSHTLPLKAHLQSHMGQTIITDSSLSAMDILLPQQYDLSLYQNTLDLYLFL